MSLDQRDDFEDTWPTGPIPFDASRHRPDPRPKWMAVFVIAACTGTAIAVLALVFGQ